MFPGDCEDDRKRKNRKYLYRISDCRLLSQSLVDRSSSPWPNACICCCNFHVVCHSFAGVQYFRFSRSWLPYPPIVKMISGPCLWARRGWFCQLCLEKSLFSNKTLGGILSPCSTHVRKNRSAIRVLDWNTGKGDSGDFNDLLSGERRRGELYLKGRPINSSIAIIVVSDGEYDIANSKM